MKTAADALQSLKEGNQRFLSDQTSTSATIGAEELAAVAEGQTPFAIILGCSDSRVPAELIFDQGLGDLFVVRVAGNVAMPSQIASIEFAAAQFGTRLVVVLGHSECGAIKASLSNIREPGDPGSPHLAELVERIKPALEKLVEDNPGNTDLVAEAVTCNVHAAVAQLTSESEILADLAKTDGLMVVGAEYSLQTGAVTFFEN